MFSFVKLKVDFFDKFITTFEHYYIYNLVRVLFSIPFPRSNQNFNFLKFLVFFKMEWEVEGRPHLNFKYKFFVFLYWYFYFNLFIFFFWVDPRGKPYPTHLDSYVFYFMSPQLYWGPYVLWTVWNFMHDIGPWSWLLNFLFKYGPIVWCYYYSSVWADIFIFLYNFIRDFIYSEVVFNYILLNFFFPCLLGILFFSFIRWYIRRRPRFGWWVGGPWSSMLAPDYYHNQEAYPIEKYYAKLQYSSYCYFQYFWDRDQKMEEETKFELDIDRVMEEDRDYLVAWNFFRFFNNPKIIYHFLWTIVRFFFLPFALSLFPLFFIRSFMKRTVFDPYLYFRWYLRLSWVCLSFVMNFFFGWFVKRYFYAIREHIDQLHFDLSSIKNKEERGIERELRREQRILADEEWWDEVEELYINYYLYDEHPPIKFYYTEYDFANSVRFAYGLQPFFYYKGGRFFFRGKGSPHSYRKYFFFQFFHRYPIHRLSWLWVRFISNSFFFRSFRIVCLFPFYFLLEKFSILHPFIKWWYSRVVQPVSLFFQKCTLFLVRTKNGFRFVFSKFLKLKFDLEDIFYKKMWTGWYESLDSSPKLSDGFMVKVRRFLHYFYVKYFKCLETIVQRKNENRIFKFKNTIFASISLFFKSVIPSSIFKYVNSIYEVIFKSYPLYEWIKPYVQIMVLISILLCYASPFFTNRFEFVVGQSLFFLMAVLVIAVSLFFPAFEKWNWWNFSLVIYGIALPFFVNKKSTWMGRVRRRDYRRKRKVHRDDTYPLPRESIAVWKVQIFDYFLPVLEFWLIYPIFFAFGPIFYFIFSSEFFYYFSSSSFWLWFFEKLEFYREFTIKELFTIFYGLIFFINKIYTFFSFSLNKFFFWYSEQLSEYYFLYSIDLFYWYQIHHNVVNFFFKFKNLFQYVRNNFWEWYWTIDNYCRYLLIPYGGVLIPANYRILGYLPIYNYKIVNIDYRIWTTLGGNWHPYFPKFYNPNPVDPVELFRKLSLPPIDGRRNLHYETFDYNYRYTTLKDLYRWKFYYMRRRAIRMFVNADIKTNLNFVDPHWVAKYYLRRIRKKLYGQVYD